MKSCLTRLKAFIEAYPRLAITGAPKTGKSTLTDKLDNGKRTIFRSDDFKHLEWSEASEQIAKEVNACDGPLIVEGVAVPRALRKGMNVDAVLWLHVPRATQLPGQIVMGRGMQTVLTEWRIKNTQIPVIKFEEHNE